LSASLCVCGTLTLMAKNQVVQAYSLKIKLVHCYTQRNNAMTALTGLKLTAVQKPTQMSPVQQRRNKLAKRLWEQAELARAQQAGTTFAPKRFRSVVQNDTGQRIQVEQAKKIKQWWFVADSGKLVLSVRYGTKLLELAKGKWAVEVGAEKDLVPTLELLKGAVLAGELDTQIEVAANKLSMTAPAKPTAMKGRFTMSATISSHARPMSNTL